MEKRGRRGGGQQGDFEGRKKERTTSATGIMNNNDGRI